LEVCFLLKGKSFVWAQNREQQELFGAGD